MGERRTWLERDDAEARRIAAEWRVLARVGVRVRSIERAANDSLDVVDTRLLGLVREYVRVTQINGPIDPVSDLGKLCAAKKAEAAGKSVYTVPAPNAEHAIAGIIASVILWSPSTVKRKPWESNDD